LKNQSTPISKLKGPESKTISDHRIHGRLDLRFALPVSTQASTPTVAPTEQVQAVSARITASVYRCLKARAAMDDTTVKNLVELAIIELLARHDAQGSSPDGKS
jgi:hypothetical protein